MDERGKFFLTVVLLLLFHHNGESQETSPFMDSAKSLGIYINYFILPEHKKVELVSIETKKKFDKVLVDYNAQKEIVDYSKLHTEDDSAYMFTLARISLVSVYSLSNGLYAVDQYINDKANSYYLCSSLADFKLITKYLLIFRPQPGNDLEVKCSIFEHTQIKEFLSKERSCLRLIEEMSNDRHRLLMAEDGKCVYISYSSNLKNNPITDVLVEAAKRNEVEWYTSEQLKNENEFYWSLVIYESMEKFKLHNIEFK